VAIYSVARVFHSWTVTTTTFSKKVVGFGLSYYEDTSGVTAPDKNVFASHAQGRIFDLTAGLMGSTLVGLPIRVWYPTVPGDVWEDTSTLTLDGSAGTDVMPLSQAYTLSFYPAVRGVPHPGRIQIPGVLEQFVVGDELVSGVTGFLTGACWNQIKSFSYTSTVLYSWHQCLVSLTHSPRPYDVSTIIAPLVTHVTAPRTVGVMTRRSEPPVPVQQGTGDCFFLPQYLRVIFHSIDLPALDGFEPPLLEWRGAGQWTIVLTSLPGYPSPVNFLFQNSDGLGHPYHLRLTDPITVRWDYTVSSSRCTPYLWVHTGVFTSGFWAGKSVTISVSQLHPKQI
jgi:hypothetical protein